MKTVRLKDYTTLPGSREGRGGARVWRERHLLPAYIDAKASGEKLHVVLDGTAGVAASFLAESFGGLVLDHGVCADELLATLQVLSMEQPELVTDVQQYIRDASRVSRR